MLTLKLATRNLLRHRGRSLVIGSILFLGALLMIVGSSVVAGARVGLEENVVERFTGHLVLVSPHQRERSVFFSERTLRMIPDYPAVAQVLGGLDFLEGYLPMMRGTALVLSENSPTEPILAFGVNFQDYQERFGHNVVAIEGRLLENGERGFLLSEATRQRILENHNVWMAPEGATSVVHGSDDASVPTATTLGERAGTDRIPRGPSAPGGAIPVVNELVLMGLSSDSLESDIRLTVTGIVRFERMDTLWEGVSFMDIESYRECFGHVTAAARSMELTDTQTTLLGAAAPEDLFGGSLIMESPATAEEYREGALRAQTERSDRPLDLDDGAWGLISVRLREGLSVEEGRALLRERLNRAGIDLQVLPWSDAAEEVARFALITQNALSAFIFCLFLVAAIVIMNTLSMAAAERTTEIGTIRAIGGRRGFVGRLFLAETSLLAALFGGGGMVVGSVLMLILARLGIDTTTTPMTTLLFGGDTFRPVVGGDQLAAGALRLALVTIVAMIYPVVLARRVTPLDAVARD